MSDHLSAASSTVDITPDTPIPLSGRYTERVAENLDSRLEANLLFLKGSDSACLIIAVDLLYVGEFLRSEVERALRDKLSPAQILFCASHTHNGPATDSSKPLLGPVSDEYLRHCGEVLVHAALALIEAPLRKVRLVAADADLHHSINRRRWRAFRYDPGNGFTLGGIGMGPNPNGARDETLTLMAVQDEDSVLAVVWNYACHPTAFSGDDALSADFPGVVRKQIRHQVGRDAPVLFLQGFSGDTRPPARKRIRTFKDVLLRIGLGPTFGDLEPTEYREWTESLAAAVTKCLSGPLVNIGERLWCHRSAVPRGKFVKGGASPAFVWFQAVRVGDLTIVGVSAELVSEFSSPLRRLANSRFVMPVGCLDGTVGYLPTAEIHREGGYEAGGFCASFGIDELAPEASIETWSALVQLMAARSKDNEARQSE